jgi:hypothetical protein
MYLCCSLLLEGNSPIAVRSDDDDGACATSGRHDLARLAHTEPEWSSEGEAHHCKQRSEPVRSCQPAHSGRRDGRHRLDATRLPSAFRRRSAPRCRCLRRRNGNVFCGWNTRRHDPLRLELMGQKHAEARRVQPRLALMLTRIASYGCSRDALLSGDARCTMQSLGGSLTIERRSGDRTAHPPRARSAAVA